MDIFEKIRADGPTFRLTEEALYAEVLRELESGLRRDGLWAKALSDSEMNFAKAHALYIRLRVQSLRDEIVVAMRLMEAEQQKREQRSRSQGSRREEMTQERERQRLELLSREVSANARRLGYSFEKTLFGWAASGDNGKVKFQSLDDALVYFRNVERARSESTQVAPPSQLQGSLEAQIFLNSVQLLDLRSAREMLDRKPELVNVQNAEGKTALHLAVVEGSADMVGLLLEARAMTNIADMGGMTPRELAIRKCKTQVLQQFEASSHPGIE